MTGSSNQPLLELPDVQTWDLDSKVVLITGGASGIGAATARLAASDGANVLVCDVDETHGRKVANEVNGHFISLDVTSADSWQAATKDLDRLDIAILNAGVEFRDPADFERTPDDPGAWNLDLYERARGVNVDGVAFGLHGDDMHSSILPSSTMSSTVLSRFATFRGSGRRQMARGTLVL